MLVYCYMDALSAMQIKNGVREKNSNNRNISAANLPHVRRFLPVVETNVLKGTNELLNG